MALGGVVPLDSHHISFLKLPGLTEGSFIISSILLLLGGGAGLVLGMKAEPVVSVDFLQGNESRDHGKWDLDIFLGGDQRREIYGKLEGFPENNNALFCLGCLSYLMTSMKFTPLR